MRIGYVVEGSTDRALVHGLRDRWCPKAELFPLGFRGSWLRPRDYPKVCSEASLKRADLVVMMTDGNGRPWRDVRANEARHLPEAAPVGVVLGIPDRNAECWICADPDYTGDRLGCSPDSFRVTDPKQPFERAIRITRDDKKEAEIAELVCRAPIRRWLERSPSFEQFYEDTRDASQRLGCRLPDERQPSHQRR